MSRKLLALSASLAIGLGASLGLAACGDDDEDDSADTQQESTTEDDSGGSGALGY